MSIRKSNDIDNVSLFKKRKIENVPKNKTKILMLVEGDSAKSFAMSGLDVIGREHFDSFPLKGLSLNIINKN